jgi:Flp pilus assembly protein TadG
MLPKKKISEWEKGQRGVTFLLVAMTMFVVLAMAALAIDVATLYTAKSEAQRAADAAALAAAHSFVITGYASDNAAGGLSGVATTMASQQINVVLQQNKIAGQPAQLAAGSPTFSLGTQGNPQVTVTVQQTGLPTFFARIWSRAAHTVSATAVAEAYNPSGYSAAPPSSAQCVKPFIVPNLDPILGGTFIDVNTGAITNPGAGGVVGEGPITFVADCPLPPLNGTCAQNDNPPKVNGGLLEFVAANLPGGALACPSCSGTGATNLENNIGCCNTTAMTCNSPTQVAITGTSWNIDTLDDPRIPLRKGLRCLIHQPPQGGGQDTLNVATTPFQIQAGDGNPLVQPPNNKVNPGDVITTSDSLITMPISDGMLIPPSGTVNVIGYMQVFVIQKVTGQEQFTGYILNVAGCGSPAGSNPVYGGGTSAIPVRLIHQ